MTLTMLRCQINSCNNLLRRPRSQKNMIKVKIWHDVSKVQVGSYS